MPKRMEYNVKTKTKVIEDYELTQEDIEQQALAQEQQAQEEQRETNRLTLEEKARIAIDANKAYLALDPPTTAEALAQVDKLTNQMNAVIRLLVRELDEIDE